MYLINFNYFIIRINGILMLMQQFVFAHPKRSRQITNSQVSYAFHCCSLVLCVLFSCICQTRTMDGIILIILRVTILVLVVLSQPFDTTVTDRYIDWLNGINHVICLNNSMPKLACKTLDYACTDLDNDTNLVIMPGLQSLSTSVVLSSVSNISIIGQKNALINCSMPNVGIKIMNVNWLAIENVHFQFCGSLQESTSVSSHNDSITVRFSSALYFLNSTYVTIFGAIISNSNGTGITMFDTGGNVSIENVYFSSNKIPNGEVPLHPGGGGLYIEFTNCTPGRVYDCSVNPFASNNYFTILNNTFDRNIASNLPNYATTFIRNHGPSWQRFGFGGGLLIALAGRALNNQFLVKNCTFTGNRAIIGGGLSLIFDDHSEKNDVQLENNIISYNKAEHGGGAIEFGFFGVYGTDSSYVQFFNCHFISNSAVYGGAVSFYSNRAKYSRQTDIIVAFYSCLWVYNEALVGAAIVLYPEDWISISSGYLPMPFFRDCEFTRNKILYFDSLKTRTNAIDSVDGAIIYSNTFSLSFSGINTFQNNSGSSIRISVGDINVLEHCSMKFIGNVARRGGAISLIGYAGLVAYKKSNISFVGNTAIEFGGAIFYDSSDYLDVLNSRRCFLRYNEVIPVDKWDAVFLFENNTAKNYGHAIYATYLEGCARASVTDISSNYNISNVFHWNSFKFFPPLGSEPHIITTDPVYLYLDRDHVEVSPGLATDVHFLIKDGLNQSLDLVLYTSCQDDCKYGNVSKDYQYVSDNKIMIQGIQNTSIVINAETLSSRLLDIQVQVDIGYCPPGYYIDNEVCQCSVLTSHELPGIVSCDDQTSQSKMLLGYWAGCITNDEGQISLATGQCPLGYCDYRYQSDGLVLLSKNCSMLSKDLCSPNNRTGLLCGECIDGYSVYFHSDRFKCGSCPHAEYGIIFYIISELIPLTLLFLVIIIFDISFTSGSLASFILFAQVLDFFDTTAFGVYYSPLWMLYLVKIYKFIFGLFNLDFFKVDQISFCLWKNASVLDVLSFKYVTTLYGFCLVGLLFVIMHFCRCNSLQKFRNNQYGGYTVTNGLMAFITITYSQLTKVSFQILTRYQISVDNYISNSSYDVVFLSGSTPFFGQEHLKYAIPAIICLLYAAIVPLVLIIQPLYFAWKRYLTDKCSCCDTNPIHSPLCCRRMLLNTKPLLDSFQYSFKDNMRVFAGLLFLYKFIISVSFAFSVTAASMYGLLELTVIIMLTIHSIFQPYSNKTYNVIDSLIYANLAIINGISLYIVAVGHTYKSRLTTIQLVLIYIPIIYFSGFVVVKLLRSCRVFKKTTEDDSLDRFDPSTLPDRLFEQDAQRVPPPREVGHLRDYGSLQQERPTF